MSNYVQELGKWCDWAYKQIPLVGREVETVIIKEIHEMQPRSLLFVRLAGISGAIAAALGAYGAHSFSKSQPDDELKRVFETANRYHFIHSLALLSVPLTRHPHIVGPMMLSGTVIFCGSCYYYALTGNHTYRKVTPYGGMMLIGAWLAMAL